MLAERFIESSVSFGRNDEAKEMLAIKDRRDGGPPRSMTLCEGVNFSVDNVWRFPSHVSDFHEYTHLIQLMATLGLPARFSLMIIKAAKMQKQSRPK